MVEPHCEKHATCEGSYINLNTGIKKLLSYNIKSKMSGCRAEGDGSGLYSQYVGGRGSLGYRVDFRPSWAADRDLSHKTGSWDLTQGSVNICTLQFYLHLKALLWNAVPTQHGCCPLDVITAVITHVKDPHSTRLVYIPSHRGQAVSGVTKETALEAMPASCPPVRMHYQHWQLLGKVTLWHSAALLL